MIIDPLWRWALLLRGWLRLLKASDLPSRADLSGASFNLLPQPGSTDHKELINVGAQDREEFDSLEQEGRLGSLSLFGRVAEAREAEMKFSRRW